MIYLHLREDRGTARYCKTSFDFLDISNCSQEQLLLKIGIFSQKLS
jgi:hypothetical protein